MIKHFLTLNDYNQDELMSFIWRAIAMKQQLKNERPLVGKVLGMIFEKSSTRTRVSFEVAMTQLGGSSIFLSPRDTQIGRGEPVADTARVLSRMVDCVMLRTFSHDTLNEFAQYSEVPVINGLTDLFHPCQLLADIQTYIEHRESITGKTVAWIGDGNNMCHSYMNAARIFGFKLNICTPAGYEPDLTILKMNQNHIETFDDPLEASKNADLVTTDVWSSMGQESEQDKRKIAFQHFQVNQIVMRQASPDALFMHCLPAHRGEEVSHQVIDGPQSVVWDQAENRLHIQKALLEALILEATSCSTG